jgi:AcrR family transcriptional regulator
MANEGVESCSARSIAQAGRVSVSALHYYFRDTDEIIDLAFRYIGTRFWQRVRLAGEEESDFVDALWGAAAAYLRLSIESDRDPTHAPLLWFEFEGASFRRGNIETVRELSREGLSIFAALTRGVVPHEPDQYADVLYSSLLGAAIRAKLFPRPVDELLREICSALDLPVSRKFCGIVT